MPTDTSFFHKHELIWSIIVVTIIPILCLIPFVDKAFHIDAPLFIWAAEHIQNNPLNFYDFSVNWYNTATPMFIINQNPPGVSYYIAFVAFLFGWSEIALHLAFILPAVAVSLGTYFLAKEFCSFPVLATLISILTPVFLVSSSTVMSDMMMVAFYVWAIVCWVYGLKYNKSWLLLLSSLLIVLSALSKYFGISLIPLLFVYTWAVLQQPNRKLLFLLLPCILLVGYEWGTHLLYEQGLILGAQAYASSYYLGSRQLLNNNFIGIIFLGGCYASAFFYIPWLWSSKIIIKALLIISLLLIILVIVSPDTIHLSFIIQLLLFAIAGIQIIALTGLDWWKRRSPSALLLGLWILGVFIFSSLLNWTVNARTLLPMLPAIGILVVRRLPINPIKVWHLTIPLIPAASVALLVLLMDYDLANSTRRAASQLAQKYENFEGTLWFQGSWGFQYYMEKEGIPKIDTTQSRVARGDLMVFSTSNTNIINFKEVNLLKDFTLFVPISRWGSTMSTALGAGFYTHQWGVLPFSFGKVPDETYLMYRFN